MGSSDFWQGLRQTSLVLGMVLIVVVVVYVLRRTSPETRQDRREQDEKWVEQNMKDRFPDTAPEGFRRDDDGSWFSLAVDLLLFWWPWKRR